MHDDQFAVGRASDIDLDHLGAKHDRIAQGGDGILGEAPFAVLQATCPVRHDHHMVSPLVGIFEALEDLFSAGTLMA